MPTERTCACGCGSLFTTTNPRRVYLNKQHCDKARNLPAPKVGANGEVELKHFSKYSQEVRNQILKGETGAKIALYDIEATHLDANIGRVLCTVIKPLNGEPTIFDAHERRFKRPDVYDDSALVQAIRNELEAYDIIVGHNSKMFDTKFVNARNLRVGQRTKKPQYQVDTMWSWSSKARAWRGLAAIQQFLETPTEKSPIAWGQWMRALGWDNNLRVQAMDEIVDHCVHDVLALEEVYLRLVEGNVIRSLRNDGGVL